jgi:hypothetical protein
LWNHSESLLAERRVTSGQATAGLPCQGRQPDGSLPIAIIGLSDDCTSLGGFDKPVPRGVAKLRTPETHLKFALAASGGLG